ncbi:tRNA-uridine aminocarboxypropyltransferase [Rhodoblastus sp. 17X3]|uniref:tRNA-uridine aminocarboxypropyltransferase n=1 Tax=Rhodoblastus sp. 17X3 TaxID=3047026 RepID=UPI0024B85F53|nr:tRNA-uridine aminocarboxypropyltransferase [Rhodoblastus sp. 17X3]MDI9848493.1 tRNA-uridine aminocarboxypropyltransferase [Rhodoblastus sp. 17X3]
MAEHDLSAPAAAPAEEPILCPLCAKPEFLCVCDSVEPVANRVSLLILQHPQEQDRLLGTARLALRALKDAQLKIGLSWPSLSKILGRDADPAQWAVLHLGAAHVKDFPPDRELVALDKKGLPLPDQDKALAGLKGVVIFDGSWAQAKTLWWRNPWVLKARRLALNPKRASLYGNLRREPRREALSTIEAAGLTLSRLERRPEIETALGKSFAAMLAKYRAALASGAVVEQAPARKGRPPRRPAKKSAAPTA